MEALFNETYYGNSVGRWAASLAVIILSLVIGKAFFWLANNIIRKMVKNTDTQLDDMLLDILKSPVVVVCTVAGLWIGVSILHLSAGFDRILQNGFRFILVIIVTWSLVRVLEVVFKAFIEPIAERSENDLDDQLIPVLKKATKIGIWILGIVIALNNAGYDVGALLAGLGIGGLALAMAAKDSVSNIFGGVTIFTDRPFKLNDRVKISGFDGWIRDIGIRSTRLETLEGRIVTLPNSRFTDSPVENVSMEPSRKVLSTLGLTYDTAPDKMAQAVELLKTIVSENGSAEEKILTSFLSFGDFSMNILLIYWIKAGEDILKTQNDINMDILTRFNAEGLEFAYPTQTIYKKELK